MIALVGVAVYASSGTSTQAQYSLLMEQTLLITCVITAIYSDYRILRMLQKMIIPVTLKFGLPAALQNKSVSIVAYNNKTGEYTEFKDTGSTIEEVVSRMQNEG